MKLTKTLTPALVGIISVTLGSTARAEMITFVVEGDVTYLSDPADLTGGATHWALSYSIDSATPDSYPDDPTFGTYRFLTFSLTIGTLTLEAGGTSNDFLEVYDGADWGPDGYELYIDIAPIPSWLGQAGWTLHTENPTVMDSDALPLTPPRLSDFESENGFAFGGEYYYQPDAHHNVGVSGTITSFIPTPATFTLMALAALIGGRRRRRWDDQ